jgi:hypothetical protein
MSSRYSFCTAPKQPRVCSALPCVTASMRAQRLWFDSCVLLCRLACHLACGVSRSWCCRVQNDCLSCAATGPDAHQADKNAVSRSRQQFQGQHSGAVYISMGVVCSSACVTQTPPVLHGCRYPLQDDPYLPPLGVSRLYKIEPDGSVGEQQCALAHVCMVRYVYAACTVGF